MLDAQITRLAIQNLPHELHALRRESLRIPEPDDQQPVRGKTSFWWTDHERLAKLATKQLRLANAIEQAIQLFVDFDQRAVKRVDWQERNRQIT